MRKWWVLGGAVVVLAIAGMVGIATWDISTAKRLFAIIDSGDESVLATALNRWNVNVTDVWGETPLIYASAKVDYRACKLLLDAGANPAMRDRKGYSALDYVAGMYQRATHYDEDVQDLKRQGITVLPVKPKATAEDIARVKQLLENALTNRRHQNSR
jgi:hypothetical protein